MLRNRYVREIKAEAEKLGLKNITAITGGKHGKIIGEYRGKRVPLTISLTPGDKNRTLRNQTHYLRRRMGIIPSAKTIGYARKSNPKPRKAMKVTRIRVERREPGRLDRNPWEILSALL